MATFIALLCALDGSCYPALMAVIEGSSAVSNQQVSRLLQCYFALRQSERTAIEDETCSLSFAELARRAEQLAAKLLAHDISGQRVALLAPQDRHWAIGFWAILLAGGTAVPLSPLHPESEQRWFLEQSRARVLLVMGDLCEGSTLTHTRRVEFSDTDDAGANGVGADVRGALHKPALAADLESAVALILYTSGTTGKPKGALITHANLFAGISSLSETWGFSAQDVLLHVLPLHHLHGICVSLLCAYCSGAKTRMLKSYDAQEVIRLASECSVLMGVPTQHKKLVEAFDALPEARQRLAKQTLTGLRLVTSGSAKLPESLGDRLQELFGQFPLERYGMTEVGIVLSNPLSGERKRGSCGKPVRGCEIRIVDESGSEVSPGEAGEIWIKGPSVFAGYDGDPDASVQAFTGGFFRSGDTATWTADGYVRILGRSSVDIIKSGGYKLSALEIEEHLRGHEVVLDAAVVGIPDDTWGERVVAVVVPSRQQVAAQGLEQELRTWLKQRIAGYKVPKQIRFQSALPRNAMGKVQKPPLIRALSAGELPVLGQ